MSAEDKRAEKDETAWSRAEDKFNSKRYSEYFDPCQEAADKSLRCLRRNGGDKVMCQDFFDAYKECKKSWLEQRREEKSKTSWF